MSTGLLQIIKEASMNAVDNAQMCDLRYGTVTSVSPLKVQITNQFVIPQSLLVVPQRLTNYSLRCTPNGESTQTVTIHNALNIADKVALLRKQGAQSYFILDRI
jgi:hypothetical protein